MIYTFGELKIDKSLMWNLARVTKINKLKIFIETDNKEKGFVDFSTTSWIRNKSFDEQEDNILSHIFELTKTYRKT